MPRVNLLFLSLSLLCAALAYGQVDRTPVVLINGYQIPPCTGQPSTATFGDLEDRLKALGRSVVWFNNCEVVATAPALRPAMEEMGAALGQAIDRLGVPEVDVVVHSMGGLILRSYLSGKQPRDGGFQPPLQPKVRRAVFLSTPHQGPAFGPLLGLFAGSDLQVRQLLPGSNFLWELARWNQNGDDLNGVDALAVGGDPVAYLEANGIMDGLVPVPSATLPYPASTERLRLVPYCHTDSGLLATLSSNCARPPYIARIDSAEHLSWQIIRSFLNGDTQWRQVGRAGQEVLQAQTGVTVRAIGADGAPVPNPASLRINGLETGRGEAAIFREVLPRQSSWTLQIGEGSTGSVTPQPGYTNATFLATGAASPLELSAAIPSGGFNGRYALAPGANASLYGRGLAEAELRLGETALRVTFRSATQVNFVLPEAPATHYLPLVVRAGGSSRSLPVLLRPATPSIYVNQTGVAPAWNGISGALSNFREGDVLSLYVTGLGKTRPVGALQWAEVLPEADCNGVPAPVLFAGRAPNLETQGIDQVNFQVPTGLVPAGQNSVQVRLRIRAQGVTSNTALITISR